MENKIKIKVPTPSIITFLKILKKLGIKISDIVNGFKSTEEINKKNLEQKQEEFGFMLFDIIVSGLDTCEDLVEKFVCEVAGLSETQYKETDFFLELLPAFKSYKGWTAFFEGAQFLEKKTQRK